MKIKRRYFIPKIINIGLDMLELFEHITGVRNFLRHSVLSPTVTKLCHLKCDHPACISVDGEHFEHIMVVALNMA